MACSSQEDPAALDWELGEREPHSLGCIHLKCSFYRTELGADSADSCCSYQVIADFPEQTFLHLLHAISRAFIGLLFK